MNKIQFGTSGHRGIIGKSFTREHLLAISNAIGQFFKSKKIYAPKVLIGYDSRTGNSPNLDESSYTLSLIKSLKDQKISVDFSDNYSPTPVISWAVKNHDYDLGIILTASHNPPNYNGIKINDAYGAPASEEITNWIQEEANRIFETKLDYVPPKKKIDVNRVNYVKPFVDHLTYLMKDRFHLPFPDFSSNYVIDTKCGSAIDIWKYLTTNSIGTIFWQNDTFSSDFNFELPDPTSPVTISALGELCSKHQCIGFSNDPDADRHVLIDENGTYISPEKITSIIIEYCYRYSISIESVSSTLANSALIKTVCNSFKLCLNETKIGFKHFTPFLVNASNKNSLAIGVESSGGFSISLHTFDKCGFLPILLILGIMKKRNMTLIELNDEIDKKYERFEFVEDATNVSTQDSSFIISKKHTSNKSLLSELFNEEVIDINYTDGLKIVFNNQDWVLCRPSGTEPLIRIYAESKDSADAKQYIEKIKALIAESPSE